MEKAAAWNNYSADPTSYDLLKAKLVTKMLNNYDYKLLVFGASWCPDSESQMPIIFQMLEETGIQKNKIVLYGLDKQKQEPEGIAEKFNIEKVPTLIVLHNEVEIGRIVEFPNQSWEDDLRIILYK